MPSTQNVSDNSLAKKRSTKSLITKELKTSENAYVGSRRSSRKSTKRGTKLLGPKIYNILETVPVNTDLEQAIDEIESKGSTSETSELLEESVQYDESDIDLDREGKFLLDLDIHSDDISLSEQEYESTDQIENPVENELDFFEELGEVPHVDEVSLDVMDDAIVEQPKTLFKEASVLQDGGKFVDPITGARMTLLEPIKSMISTTEKVISPEESKSEDTETETETEKEEDEDEDKQPPISKDDIQQEEDFEEPVEELEIKRASQEIAEETFKLFLETIEQKETQVAEKTEPTEQDLLRGEQNKKLVTKVIDKLIAECVAKAEYYNRDLILRTLLDKRKLMRELKSIHDLLELEGRTSQFLNRKRVHHLKRKGAFGMISAERESTLTMYRNNFHNALSGLDNWLARERDSKDAHSPEFLDLQQQFKDAEQKSREEVDKLEELIRGAFQRKNFEKLKTSVEKHLKHMSAIRKEISKVRARLLLQQHQQSSLKIQMKKLEDLGSGLTIHDFEALETETFAMSNKIEEHNSALKRLHDHFNDDVHRLAHLKEKQKMALNIITAQKSYYEDLLQEKRSLREYITEMKLDRNRCRQEIDNLSYRSGLLSKPALMQDYDQTVERTRKLKETNEDLKTTIQELSDKIALLEKHCMM